MDATMLEGLGRYLATRDQERRDAAAGMFDALAERERLLVKEAAVMGFVQGEMFGRATTREDFPKDRAIVARVLMAVRDFAELYPTLAALDTPHPRPSEDRHDERGDRGQ